MFEDTIIAVSTPMDYGALGIVRLSGDKALPIANKIFKPKKAGKKITPRQPILGNLFSFNRKDIFEEAYLTFFPAPHTYTREDVVEISCHGNPLILEEVIRLGIRSGARHARPGEFTLRAYLRGRIDILQAEAINDIIMASSLNQVKISMGQVYGGLSKKISSLRSQVIHLLSQIEALIEFPEEGFSISSRKIIQTLEHLIKNVQKLIESYQLGKILEKGLSIAITGRTNVGKSTLFNSLLKSDRAIVTPYPGTTRDYLSEKIKIKNALFNLVDMAGIDHAELPAEIEAVKKGRKISTEADGILLILDTSRKESTEDIQLIEKYKKKKTLLLFNKIDLPQKMNTKRMKNLAENLPCLEISALKKINLDKLKDTIHEVFIPDIKKGDEIILHLRQKLLLEDMLSALKEGIRLLKEGYSEEIYIEEFRKTLPLIGQLTGEIRTNEIIENIFNNFCVGK